MKKKPLSTGAEWTFELIQAYDREIARIAKDFKLDTYPNQIEIISAEQMMDAYASVGMPIGYHHWSFGKHFVGALSCRRLEWSLYARRRLSKPRLAKSGGRGRWM